MLTKEKIDRQLSGQTSATTPFIKIGDFHYSNNKIVSFSIQDLIREQLDRLTSMVYNMSIQKEGNNIPFKPQVHQKRKRGQGWQNFGDRDRNRLFSRDRVNYRLNFNLTIEYNHKIEVHRMGRTIEEEAIDTKIMELEVKIEIEAEIE